MNTIQIKHGNNAPPNGVLSKYELGYSTKENKLYIGVPSGDGTISKEVAGLRGASILKITQNIVVHQLMEFLQLIQLMRRLLLVKVLLNM